jgi:hypothetical protein
VCACVRTRLRVPCAHVVDIRAHTSSSATIVYVLWPQNVSDTVNLVERMHREIAHLESYVRASKTGTAANILGVALHPKRRVAQSKSLIEENERLLGRLPTASFGVNFDPASTGKSHAAAETDDSAAASATAGLFRLFDVSTVSIFARKLKNAAITSRNDGWELDSVQSARIRSTIPTTTEAGAKRRRESVAHFTKIAAPAQRDATVDAVSEARTVVDDTTQVEVCCSADTLARHKQPVGLSPKLVGLRIALSLTVAPACPCRASITHAAPLLRYPHAVCREAHLAHWLRR